MKMIDKDTVVAEIKKKIEAHKETLKNCDSSISEMVLKGSMSAYQSFLHFLETLEVKEVDLEKYLKEDIEDVFFDLNGVAVKGATHYLTVEDVRDIAKHFFELGLSHSVDESVVRKIIDLYFEAVKHYDEVIKQERNETGGSQLAIDILNGSKDMKELCIRYVLDKITKL